MFNKIFIKIIAIVLIASSFCNSKKETLDNILPSFTLFEWSSEANNYSLKECEFKLVTLDENNGILEAKCFKGFEPYFLLESVKFVNKSDDFFDIISDNDYATFTNLFLDKQNKTLTQDSKKHSLNITNLAKLLPTEISFLKDALGSWENIDENSDCILISIDKKVDDMLNITIHFEDNIIQNEVYFYSTNLGILLLKNTSPMYLELGYGENDNINEIILRRIKDGLIYSCSLEQVESRK